MDDAARLAAVLAERYRIERELGRGGMAIVYLATDVKHGRAVAIKLLRPELAHALGPERFIREIEVTARLDHPHILSLLDSGTADGLLYYVMPYVEGESLRDRLNREKHLSIHDALRIACEVADALSYAHANGVIHRDIKPENILLGAGHARVADFGIARAVTIAGADRLTQTGLSVGTPAYMSPEQAGGSKDIDSRTDIYSLACVTYELLGGQPPFTGPTPESVIRQHLVVPPHSVAELRPSVSQRAAVVIGRGLAKVPADRFTTAAEFAAALRASEETAPSWRAASSGTRHDRIRATVPWVVAAGAVAVASLLATRPTPLPITQVRRTAIDLPDSAPVAFVGSSALGIARRALAIAPDGSTLAYVAAVGSTTMLYTRRLDESTVKPVPGSEGAYAPFFSPDSKWIAFLTKSELKKASIAGGAALTLATLDEALDAIWLPDGRILVCGGRLVGALASGGVGRLLGCAQSLSPSSIGNRWVLAYPNREISFIAPTDSAPRIVLTADGVVRPVADVPLAKRSPGSSPSIVGGTHLVFAQSGGKGTLLAMPFDAASMRSRGDLVPVVTGVRVDAGSDGVAQYAVSDEGTLVYARGTNEMASRLIFRGRDGRTDTLPFPRMDIDRHELSRDGHWLTARLWRPGLLPRPAVFDLRRGTFTLLPDLLDHCRWTRDSRTVLCGSRGPGGTNATLRVVVATGAIEDTLTRSGDLWSASSDERVLVVAHGDPDGGVSLVRRMAGHEEVVRLDGANVLSKISPSGRWIAMTVTAGGASQIFVARTTNVNERYKISTTGGEEPLWSANEDEIVYRYGSRWYSVILSTRNGLTFTAPKVLFEGHYYNARGYSHALAPDGRLLLVLGSPERTSNRIEVVTGWFEELRRLAPATRR